MDDMNFHSLVVAHNLKDAAGHGLDPATTAHLRRHGFFLDTCLRQLIVLPADHAQLQQQLRKQYPQLEWRSGSAAYSFLLKTATGLNSSIPGETNILGQFKQGWQQWRQHANTTQVQQLAAHMHCLFSDSRTIRRDYLQGIGGNSYGSLTRKLLQADSSARILFVGAGKLSRSMTIMFRNNEIGVWHHKAVTQFTGDDCRIFTDATTAAQWATHAIVTTPVDTRNDQHWAQLATANIDRIVHLGRRRAEPGVWESLRAAGNYFDLDDVFDLRKAQSNARSLQIYRAALACERIACATEAAVTTTFKSALA
jgi:hypothetical protein